MLVYLSIRVNKSINEQAILATYTAVGILEYWDLSMQLFDARVTSPVWDWQNMEHSNKGRRSGLRDEVRPNSNPKPLALTPTLLTNSMPRYTVQEPATGYSIYYTSITAISIIP